MARSVPGQLPFSLGAAVVGVGAAVVAMAGLVPPVMGGALVGAGVALALAELAAVSRLSPTAGLLVGGVGAGVVVIVADGVVDLSLPGLVAGAAGGLVLSGAARYAEHVIAGEGPAGVFAAVLSRLTIPVRDLALALGVQPLRQPALPPPTRGTRR